MLNGLACWVLQCVSPSLFASLPFLPSALLASLPTSFSGSRSPLFFVSLSRTLGRTAARQYLDPAYPCTPHRFQEGSLRSQPTRGDKLIPRCSDGNVTWRARRQRGFPPTRRRRKGGKRRKSTDERRGASQIVDDVTGNDDDDDNDDDGKGVMEAESRYGN